MYYKQEFGKLGEDIAADYLFDLGYSIIERNFACKCGEIDIIAYDETLKDSEIVFVEVKSRIDARCGEPAEAVNRYKKNHIKRVAEFFLMINHLESSFCRFDVVEILSTHDATKYSINHIKNAIYD